MIITKFEDLIAWQKSQEFAVEIYKLFSHSKDYGFKDQITRAVISISNNIAEGFEKRTKPDFSRFLYISKGSCGEVRSMLYLAQKLNYIDMEKMENLISKSNEISKILVGLIKSNYKHKI